MGKKQQRGTSQRLPAAAPPPASPVETGKTRARKLSGLPIWRNPRFRYGGISTAVLALVIAALIGLNGLFTALERRNGWRVDLSFNALTTTSAETEAILQALPHDVRIYALFAHGDEDLQLFELLDRYAAASGRVRWEQVDVSLNPALLTSLQQGVGDDALSTDSLVVTCPDTGRYRALTYDQFLSYSLDLDSGDYQITGLTYERSLTSAISYVAQDQAPRVMILQGHGELDETAAAPLARLLDDNNYDVYFFNLYAEEAQLSGEDLLMILSPQRDLTRAELEQLTAFIDAGGALFFSVDYTDPLERMPNMTALLRLFGFIPEEGLVVASETEPNSFYNRNRIYLLPLMQSTDLTGALVESRHSTLLLPGCRGFALPGETTDRGLTVTAQLLSGQQAYLKRLTSADATLARTEEDQTGPFALALSAQRLTDSGNLAKAFAVGCSGLLTSEEVYSMTDAELFLVTVARFLKDNGPGTMDIPVRSALRPRLGPGSAAVGTALIVALPLLVLAAALIVLLPRRHR